MDLDGLAFHYAGRDEGERLRSAPEPQRAPQPIGPATAARIQEEHDDIDCGDDDLTPLEPGAVASLRKLLDVTKTADGRRAAVEGGVARSCAAWLAASSSAQSRGMTRRGYEHLTLLMRCLRNLCVSSPPTQATLWKCGAVAQALAVAVAASGEGASTPPGSVSTAVAAVGCAAMAVQFLGNSIAGNSDLAEQAWALLYPAGFGALLEASTRVEQLPVGQQQQEEEEGPSLACCVGMLLQTVLAKASDGSRYRQDLAITVSNALSAQRIVYTVPVPWGKPRPNASFQKLFVSKPSRTGLVSCYRCVYN